MSAIIRGLFMENVWEMPNPFCMQNGKTVTTKEEFEKRLDEIQALYESEMYGALPDATKEKVTYSLKDKEMKVCVECEGRKGEFTVLVEVPKMKRFKETPVLFVFFKFFPEQLEYALNQGYAVLAVNPYEIAKDAFPREGVFYQVHPYTENPKEQTGALAAWGWGFSKAIDALVAGAAKELGLSTTDIALTGVSRFGKSTAVAGAFDKRIRVIAPSCSGAGGMALYRYVSEGKKYDFTDVSRPADYTFSKNEPLSCLQSDSEGHWFNDRFRTYKSVEELPLEQYMLSALCARDGRYLFISGSYCDEDWVNSPAMWMNYLASREIFDFMGISDHLAICLHETGHMVTMSDLAYLLEFCNLHFYGIRPSLDFEALSTSLYAKAGNDDPVFEKKLAFLH